MAVAPESKLLEDPVEKGGCGVRTYMHVHVLIISRYFSVGRNLIRCFHDCFSSHHIPGDVLELLGSLQKVWYVGEIFFFEGGSMGGGGGGGAWAGVEWGLFKGVN